MAARPGLVEPGFDSATCTGLGISSPDVCTALYNSMTDPGIYPYITPPPDDVETVAVEALPKELQAALNGCDGNESCNLIAADFGFDGTITTSNLTGASYGYDTRYTSGNDTAAIIKIQPFTDQFGIPLGVKKQAGDTALVSWSTPIILDGGAPMGYTYDVYETFTSGPIAGTDTTQPNSAGCSSTCDANGSCVGFNYNETNDACVLYGTGATKTMQPDSLSHAYSKITVPPAGWKKLSDLVLAVAIEQPVNPFIALIQYVLGPSVAVIASGQAGRDLVSGISLNSQYQTDNDDATVPGTGSNPCGNNRYKIGDFCYGRCAKGMQRGTNLNKLASGYVGTCYACGLTAGDPIYKEPCTDWRAYGGPVNPTCPTDYIYDEATAACKTNCGDREFIYNSQTKCCSVGKTWTMYADKCCPVGTHIAADWETCVADKEYVMPPGITKAISRYAFSTTDRYPLIKTGSGAPTQLNRHWDDDGQTCADVNACNVSVKRLLNDDSVTSFMTDTIKACRGCAGRGAQRQSDNTWHVWYEKALTIFHANFADYTPSGSTTYTQTVRSILGRICEPPRLYKTDGSFVSTYQPPDIYSDPCSHMHSSLYVTGVTSADLGKMVWYNYNSNTYAASSTPVHCVVENYKLPTCPAAGCASAQSITGYISTMPQNGGKACPPLSNSIICPSVTTCAVLTGYANGTNLIWYLDGRGITDWATHKAKYGTLAGDKAIESSYSGTYKIYYYSSSYLYEYPNPLMYIYGYGTATPTVITKPNPKAISATPKQWVSLATGNGLMYNAYRTYSGITSSAGSIAGLNGPYAAVSPYRVYYSIRGAVPYIHTNAMRATFPAFMLTAMTKPTTEPGSYTCLQRTGLDYGATISQYNTTCVPTCVLNNKDAFAASVAYDGIGKCAVTCRAETGIEKATGSGQCNKVFLSAGMSFAANSNILVRDDVTLEYRNDRLTFKNTMSGHVIFQPEHGSGTDMNGYYVWGSMTSCGFDTDAGVILFKYTMFSISTDGFNTVTSALVTYSTSLPAGAATYKPFTLAITANHNLVIKDRDGVIAWIADEFGGHTDRRTYQDGEDTVGRDASFVGGVLLDERYGGRSDTVTAADYRAAGLPYYACPGGGASKTIRCDNIVPHYYEDFMTMEDYWYVEDDVSVRGTQYVDKCYIACNGIINGWPETGQAVSTANLDGTCAANAGVRCHANVGVFTY